MKGNTRTRYVSDAQSRITIPGYESTRDTRQREELGVTTAHDGTNSARRKPRPDVVGEEAQYEKETKRRI